jgi:hypothetical protein
MNKLYPFITVIFMAVPGMAQPVHKDQMEYGYKGKVKVIVKKNFPNPTVFNQQVVPTDSSTATTYTYYFNENGNMDSTTTEGINPFGELFIFRTVYRFENGQKAGWTSYNKDAERLAYGKITWENKKSYTEKAYYDNDAPRGITKTTLNDSFRIIKIAIKTFDISGNPLQDDIQEFQLDSSQHIRLYKTTHQKDASSDSSHYEYLANDAAGNPTRLVISRPHRNAATLVTIDYSYYQ